VAFYAEYASLVGEEQHGVMRIGGYQKAYRVLFACRHAYDAAPSPVLQDIGLGRHAFHETALRERNHHILVRDQVFFREAQRLLVGYLGGARIAELAAERFGLFLDKPVDARRIGQQVLQIGNGLFDLFQLIEYLLAFEIGQAAELHVEDGLRLYLGKLEALHKSAAGGIGVGRLAYGLDDLVQKIERYLEAFKYMLAVFGDAQLVLRTPRDNFLPEIYEGLQRFFERDDARLAVNQRQHVDEEGILHLRMLVEVVEHLARLCFALQLHNDTHTLAVGLVTQLAYARDLFILDQLGDTFHQRGLIDLIGKLGNDYLLPL